MEMGEIVIQNVNQVYHNVNQGDFNALSDINLHLCKGESLAIEGDVKPQTLPIIITNKTAD